MSGSSDETSLGIKVVMKKGVKEVLFAEAGSEFTDVLLSFMLLPLGTIVGILQKRYADQAPVIGSLNSLVGGLKALGTPYLKNRNDQKYLLAPPSCYERELDGLIFNVSSKRPINSRLREYEGVFTRGTSTFIISDDLRIVPNEMGSAVEAMAALGMAVTGTEQFEVREVKLQLPQVIMLLKFSLISRNPLTATIFPEKAKNLVMDDRFLYRRWTQIPNSITSLNPTRMTLKLVFQNSTKKLLFAQSDCHFINFLFRLQTISIGKIVWFLGGETGLQNLDNMHRSVTDDLEDEHFKESRIKDWLIKSSYVSTHGNEFADLGFSCLSFVKENLQYMVKDDLTVIPFSVASHLSVLNELEVSIHDIEELQLDIGLEEGLSIVKAALTSDSVLTDGLIKPTLNDTHLERFSFFNSGKAGEAASKAKLKVISKKLRLLLLEY